MKKAVGIYSVIIGISVICLWLFILVNQSVPEGKIELGFHLYAEFSMAVVCLVSGIMMMYGRPFATETNIGGMGMVSYASVNAAGYYGQQNDYFVMFVFILLFLSSIATICLDYLIIKYR